jgi:hypothetical protein
VARRCIAVLTVALASILVAGCHLFGSGEPKTERWGGFLQDLRYEWDAEPGIDVTTGAIVPVRAYVESRRLAQSMGNMDYVYPGFTSAVPPDDPRDHGWGLQPNVNHPLDEALVGNGRYHILSVSRTGNALTVTMCNYDYSIAVQQADGRLHSVAADTDHQPKGINAERMTLTAPSAPPSTTPQAGPSPAPSDDVFGGWRITGYLFTPAQPGLETQWPTYDADLAECVEKAPDSPERRAYLVNGAHPRSDFPTSPPSPGWPAPKP